MPAESDELVQRRLPPPMGQSFTATAVSLPGSGRDGWSLGDLLARASRDDSDNTPTPSVFAAPETITRSPARAAGFDLGAITAAIDPMTSATSWARHRIGERGVITRNIYTSAGQQTFDQIANRLRIDSDFRNMADRYIADFERVLTQAEQRDPTGQALLSQIQTETGRVFLLLAHASGRLGQ